MRRAPIRTCIGCGRKSQKWDLIRIGYTKDGRLLISLDAKGEGRGAYVCPNPKCIQAAMNPKKLNRFLRAQLDQDRIDSLKAQLLELLGRYRGGIDNGKIQRENGKGTYDKGLRTG